MAEIAPMESTDRAAHWFAVYTKPRQERTALFHLENQGFQCFLPMALNPYQKASKRNEDRTEPLFPRYLFLRAVPAVQNLATVRSTRGVVSLVRTGHELVKVPELIIRALQARRDIETGLIALDPVQLDIGDRVRVFDGPFAGAEGILQQRSGEARSLLLMKILGRETTLEVDSLLLQRAG